jgi:hypothetical protein
MAVPVNQGRVIVDAVDALDTVDIADSAAFCPVDVNGIGRKIDRVATVPSGHDREGALVQRVGSGLLIRVHAGSPLLF